MEVRLVTFPETPVISITHRGPPELEHETVRKLVAWKLRHRLFDQTRYRSYGLHYTDPRTVDPEDHRVDFCLSIDRSFDGELNGFERKTIPTKRCALARDIGSRINNKAAAFLYEHWLPGSGEALSGYPFIFHYVNVGPDIADEDAITDVYMPLE